jgi:ACS family hexuronate transporter-like MFS transporter
MNPPRLGRYRWVICALLFLATTVNYVDRQVLGILAPDLQKEIGWSEQDYGNIVAAFQAAYAVGLLLMGRFMDWLGARKGFALAVLFWSVAAMAHAAARSAFGFGLARFGLGLGEAGNFPACIKTVAEWFPKRERATATGLFNAGSNIGAVVAPLVVPVITLHYGWRWAFILTGALGFVWVAGWMALYRPPQQHPRVSPAELAYIRSDPPEPEVHIPWLRLLPHRQMLAFALGKFLTDPIWWFYLYWVPKFLNKTYGLTLETMGLPLVVIYLAADVGSIGGGWLSSSLIQRGWSINAARKLAMLVCAVCVVPIVFAAEASELWVAVGLLGLVTAAHQGWSANLFTTASDMFPRRAVGSVVGLGGMAGAIGGMLAASAAGRVLETTGSYWPLFVVAGSAYLVALAVMQVLAPRLERADVGGGPNEREA